MKKIALGLVLSIMIYLRGYSQYVTLPDTNFIAALDSLGFGACLNGNMLDTTCPAILNARILNLPNVINAPADLTGLQYFKSLDTLMAANLLITHIPAFPSTLTYINIAANFTLDSIPPLPPLLAFLDVNSCHFSSLPPFPDSLQVLYCGGNQLTALPTLPQTLTTLYCDLNHITSLNPLPQSGNLTTLDCSQNPITVLPLLPEGLSMLNCERDSLISLPALPHSLTQLVMGDTVLYALPVFPDSLQYLSIWNTRLHSLSFQWPLMIEYFDCSYNPLLDSLPDLPITLTSLQCTDDPGITFIRTLPVALKGFDCSYNNITNLPSFLPSGLTNFNCAGNQLTSIPPLTAPVVDVFDLSGNTGILCMPLYDSVTTLYFLSTGINCVPGYSHVHGSYPSLSTLPLCAAGNASGCPTQWNISGAAFTDTGTVCIYSAGETVFNNIKIELWQNNAIAGLAFTNSEGLYSFIAGQYGVYDVTTDTTFLPFTVMCPTGNEHVDTVSVANYMHLHQDFSLVCPTGFDLGVLSIAPVEFYPGELVPVIISAGDIANFYNASCAHGVGGQVVVTFNGPVDYAAPQHGANLPTVSGDSLIWNVADFGAVNALTDFEFTLHTLYSAQITDQVCISASISLLPGDNNALNNSISNCFTVHASWDPNLKEVSPVGNVDTAQPWLTYTVHFQNTGTGPAVNVDVADTIDVAHLDISTFQLLAYSSQPKVQIQGNGAAMFTFDNINLPDSTVSFTGSQGFVKYKIKLKDDLPANTQVSNTASVYFDLNAPVVTNTVTNTVNALQAGVLVTPDATSNIKVNTYPNPFSNLTNIQISGLRGTDKYTFNLYDVTGRLQINIPSSTAVYFQITRGALAAGIYTYRLTLEGNMAVVFGKLVVE